jgi:hypothetical protein
MRPLLLAAAFLCTAKSFAGISLPAIDGRSWHDTDFDGNFNNGASTFGATQLVPFSNNARAARGGIMFSVADFPTDVAVSSATLTIHFSSAVRDINEILPDVPYFGNPNAELHGFTDPTGIVMDSGVESDNLLSEFEPAPNTPVTFDVTGFLNELLSSGQSYAGFSIRVADDLNPNTRAEAWFWSWNRGDGLAPTMEIGMAAVPEASTLIAWLTLICSVSVSAAVNRWRNAGIDRVRPTN